jgi:tyrosine-protein phosphatase SIW14
MPASFPDSTDPVAPAPNATSSHRPRNRLGRRAALVVTALAILAVLGYWRYWHHSFRRLQEVRPGVLYRMGQPSEYGLRQLARDPGIRTVLCLREDTARLRAGLLFDVGDLSGPLEAETARELGIQFLQWPLDNEVYFPWPTPWNFEQYRRLLDDPANFPILVHCRAGKHRAGTFAALFRLEYDRWDVERTLTEMYSFGFGKVRPIQEHNLRTYLPRPRPDQAQWDALRGALSVVSGNDPPADYDHLVRLLRAARDQPAVRSALANYVEGDRPFAVCLAARLIDSADDPLASTALKSADRCLTCQEAAEADWAISAALVADFGRPDRQRRLIELLEEGTRGPEPAPRYQAMVAGATNRYTRNRIAYLRPLLADVRQRPEPAAAAYRYADTAVVRLMSIINEDFLGRHGAADRAAWDRAIEATRAWFAKHPDEARPGVFAPPEPPAAPGSAAALAGRQWHLNPPVED